MKVCPVVRAKTRIEAVEMTLNGKIDEGSLSSRLEALANIRFTDGVYSVESRYFT